MSNTPRNDPYTTRDSAPKQWMKRILTNKWVLLILGVLLVIGLIKLTVDIIAGLFVFALGLIVFLVAAVLLVGAWLIISRKIRDRN